MEEPVASTSAAERQQVLRRVLRECHAAEVAASRFFAAQHLLLHGRPDVAHFRDAELKQLAAVEELLPRYRSRPSLLNGALGAAGFAAGAAAALAPRRISLALSGALQEALSERCNEQLRSLRDAGCLTSTAPGGGSTADNDTTAGNEVREVVRGMRDAQRAPEDAPLPPDLLALQRMERLEDIGVTGLLGALAKLAATTALSAASKL